MSQLIGEKTRLLVGEAEVREMRSLMDFPCVSLLFPAYNRLEFTKQAWWALQANTDWSFVKEFHVYDDGSTDGTWEWLQKAPSFLPPTFHRTNFRSPMGVTLDWIKQSVPDWGTGRTRQGPQFLAKLDNDTIYPPFWLAIALEVLRSNPDLDMLGLECMRQPAIFTRDHYSVNGVESHAFGYLPAKFISGLGVYRAGCFARSLPADNGYFGLEEWQMAQRGLRYGWILPSLPTILLDRLPVEPWAALSRLYVSKGWQRARWGDKPLPQALMYHTSQHEMWDWWRPYEEEEL